MTVGQLRLCPAQVGNDLPLLGNFPRSVMLRKPAAPLHGQLFPPGHDGDLLVVLRGNRDDCDVACGRWCLFAS
jgi:hypothetical protein